MFVCSPTILAIELDGSVINPGKDFFVIVPKCCQQRTLTCPQPSIIPSQSPVPLLTPSLEKDLESFLLGAIFPFSFMGP